MSRNTRRLAVASLALGLGLTGTAAAVANDDAGSLGGILNLGDVGRVVNDDLPVITGDVEGGLGGLLSGDTGLLGGILGGTGGLVDGLLGGLGAALDPELAIQPIDPVGGGETLENPNVAAGLLDGLLGIGSITESLAGHL